MKQSVISRDPDVMGGTAVFSGTRVPVQTLLDYLEAGETVDAFLRRLPIGIARAGHRFLGTSEGATDRSCLVKVLLDECVDRRLARDLADHDVKTARQVGWTTIKNGELLALASNEFDVFVTVDRNLSFQQNIASFPIAVVVFRAPGCSRR
jgi:predicted nuclease of predicted toxin-antitoxin system